MIDLSLVLLLAVTPEQAFQKIQSAHEGMTVGIFKSRDALTSVAASVVSLKDGTATIALPNQQIVVATNRDTRFYDKIFDMVAVSPNDQKVKPVTAIVSVSNFHREPTAFLLDASIREAFFKDAQKSKGWVVTPNRLTLRKPNGTTLIGFDSKYRITEIQTSIGKKLIQSWKYEYPTAFPFSIPSTAAVVRGLPERPSLPKGTKADAVGLSVAVWNAMSRFRSGTVVQQIDKEMYTSKVVPGSFEETCKTGSWRWTKAQLEVRPKGKPATVISKQTETYMDRLRKAGLPISPMARFAFNRQVPFLELFRNAAKVSVEGTISTGGRKMKMLSIQKVGTKLRLLIDAESNRVAQLSSDTIDRKGKATPGGRLVLSYR